MKININIRKSLLTTTALAAVGALAMPQAQAQTQTKNLDGSTYNNGGNDELVTDNIDTAVSNATRLGNESSDITFGSDGTRNAITHDDGSGITEAIKINETGNKVTFAEDAVVSGNSNNVLDIGVAVDDFGTRAKLELQGSVLEQDGATANISLADSGNTDGSPVVLSVDSVNDEDLTIDAEIDNGSNDTTRMFVTDSDGAGNKITFTDKISDPASNNGRLDSLIIGDDSTGNDVEVEFQDDITTNSAENFVDIRGNSNAQHNVIFNTGPNGDITMDTSIQGDTDSTETVTVDGNGTLIQNGIIGRNTPVDELRIEGGATIDSNDEINADDITMGAGGTLKPGVAGTTFDNDITGDGGTGTLTADQDMTLNADATGLDTIETDGGDLTYDTAGLSDTLDAEANTLQFVQDDTMTFDTVDQDTNVQGAITSVNGNEGTVEVLGNNTATYEDDLGTADNPLNAVDLASGNSTADFKGDVYTNNDLAMGSGDNEIRFSGDGEQIVSGIVDDNTDAGNSTVTVDSDVTFLDKIGDTNTVDTLDVLDGGSAEVQDNMDVGEVTLNNSDFTLNTGPNGGLTLDTNIEGDSTGMETVTVNGGNTLTQNDIIGDPTPVDELRIEDGTTLESNAAINANDGITIGENAILKSGMAGSTFDTDITGDGGTGTLTAAEDMAVNANATDLDTIETDGGNLTYDTAGLSDTLDVGAENLQFVQDDAMTFDTVDQDITVQDAITSVNGNEGTVEVLGNNTATYEGALGTSDNPLNGVDLASGDSVAEFSEDVYTNNDIAMGSGNDEIVFNGSQPQTVSGIVDDNTDAGNSTVTVNNDVTFLDKIGDTNTVDTLNVKDDASAEVQDDMNVGGITLNNSTLRAAGDVSGGAQIDASASNPDITVDPGAGNTSTLAVGKGLGDGDTALDIGTGSLDFKNGPLEIETAGESDLEVGESFTVLKNSGGTDLASQLGSNIMLQGSAILGLEDDGSDSDNLRLSLSPRTGNLGATGATNAADSLLTANAGSVSGLVSTVRDELLNAGSNSEAERITDQARNEGAGGTGTSQAASTVTSTNVVVVNSRLASLRDAQAGAGSGIATGNGTMNRRIWGKVTGARGEQDSRDGESGFTTDGWGLTFGADTRLSPDSLIGAAVSYNDSRIDGDDAANSRVDVESWQITAYGKHDLANSAFVTGQLAYSMHNFDQRRTVIGQAVSADYDGDQIMARIGTGRDYQARGFTVTPNAHVKYSYQDHDEYTSSDNTGATFQTVDPDAPDALDLGIGVDVSHDLKRDEFGGVMIPTLNLGYKVDVLNESYEASKAFSNVQSRVDEGMQPSAHTFNVGGSFDYATAAGWTFTADYDFKVREGYESHNGMLKAKYNF